MRPRDILAVVASTSAGEPAIALAESLAANRRGRVTAALVNWLPNVAPIDGYVIDPLYGRLVEEAKRQIDEEQVKLARRLTEQDINAHVEPYFIDYAAAGVALGARAKHVDLSVVCRPTRVERSLAQTLVEAVLFNSGRPVLMAPPEWKRGDIGRNVLIAWKPTQEAARAVGDAEPFIMGADRVSVVTVDASPDRGYSEQPGADITEHLSFRGAKTELFNLNSSGRSETRAILDQAMVVGADLIVMGGYGRSRLSEFIFGGVTREILRTAELPVLMAH